MRREHRRPPILKLGLLVQMALDGPGPKEFQDLDGFQDDLKRPHDGPKMAQDGPKMPEHCPKMASRQPPKRPLWVILGHLEAMSKQTSCFVLGF